MTPVRSAANGTPGGIREPAFGWRWQRGTRSLWIWLDFRQFLGRQPPLRCGAKSRLTDSRWRARQSSTIEGPPLVQRVASRMDGCPWHGDFLTIAGKSSMISKLTGIEDSPFGPSWTPDLALALAGPPRSSPKENVPRAACVHDTLKDLKYDIWLFKVSITDRPS